MDLNKRKRGSKRLPARVRLPLIIPIAANDTWSKDFPHDTLMNGRKVKMLNILNDLRLVAESALKWHLNGF